VTGNVAATYVYRREIAQAISRYSASIKKIFEAHGSPVPPSPECAGAMGNAWGTCRVDFYKADQRLEAARCSDCLTADSRNFEGAARLRLLTA
jgi:hypothetical protein